MVTRRGRIAGFLAVAGVIGLIAAAALHYRRSGDGGQAADVARSGRVGHNRRLESVPASGAAAEPYGGGGTARLRARAALQECLQQAALAAKTSWDGMCAALAQRNGEQRDHCRDQGRAVSECQAAYADTPLKDCLLPHATASSVAQAEQSAKSDCYQQFQAEMR
jgi:hypothetical protein